MKKKKNHPVHIRIKRAARLNYLKLLRLNDPPERIARGAAIGVAMGILPTFGLGTLLSLACAFILRANKAAAIVGSFIMNPLTSPFFWTLSVILGSVVLREDRAAMMQKVSSTNGENVLRHIGWATFVYMTGNVIITVALTGASYYLVKGWVARHRAKKAARLSGGARGRY